MNETRTVMYVGTKPSKNDRTNNELHRVWPGTGSVVEGIPSVQAAALCRHPDEFIDVTGLDVKQLAARAAKAKVDVDEKKRNARVITSDRGGVLLSYASDEQILAEVKRRKLAQKIVGAAPVDAAPTASDVSEKEQRDADAITKKVQAAIETLIERDSPDDFEDGLPTKAAVQEVIGYALSDSEFESAICAVA